MNADESPIGIWLWLALLAIIIAYVVGADLWLYYHGHELLTTEFKEGLRHPAWGPILIFLTTGTVAAFLWHMLNTRDGNA